MVQVIGTYQGPAEIFLELEFDIGIFSLVGYASLRTYEAFPRHRPRGQYGWRPGCGSGLAGRREKELTPGFGFC